MEQTIESKDNLQLFFQNLHSRLANPEFLYGLVMAISFVSACILGVASAFLLVRLVRIRSLKKNRQENVDAGTLSVPTLNTLKMPPKHMVHHPIPKTISDQSVEEAVASYLRNQVQPNRISSVNLA